MGRPKAYGERVIGVAGLLVGLLGDKHSLFQILYIYLASPFNLAPLPDAQSYAWIHPKVAPAISLRNDDCRGCERSTENWTPSSSGDAMLTLSNRQVDEVFVNDTLRKIGGFAFNTETGRAYRGSLQGQEDHGAIHEASETDLAFEHRIHDPRVGRFLSLDPLASKFPYYSPYHFSGNSPISTVD